MNRFQTLLSIEREALCEGRRGAVQESGAGGGRRSARGRVVQVYSITTLLPCSLTFEERMAPELLF
jgi:hypothetical protein